MFLVACSPGILRWNCGKQISFDTDTRIRVKAIMKHDWMDFDRGVVTEIVKNLIVKNLIFWSVLLGQQSSGSKETRYNPLMHIWPRDDDCHGAEVFVTS